MFKKKEEELSLVRRIHSFSVCGGRSTVCERCRVYPEGEIYTSVVAEVSLLACVPRQIGELRARRLSEASGVLPCVER